MNGDSDQVSNPNQEPYVHQSNESKGKEDESSPQHQSQSKNASDLAKHENGFTDQNYLDASWPSNLLLDANSDLLYNMDFSNNLHQPNTIAHNIQYQNDITTDLDLHDPSFVMEHQPTDSNKQPLPNNQIQVNLQQQPEQQPEQQVPGQTTTINTQSSQKPNTIEQANNTTSQQPVPATKSKQRRPCDHCRRKKTKCVIIPGTNNCAQCETKSLTCTYVGQALKRKPVDSPEEPNKKLKNSKDSNISLLQNDIIPPNVPIRDVAPIQDYSSMNNSLLKKTLSLQFPRSSFYVGPTSYLYDINLLNMILGSQNTKSESKLPGPQTKVEQINLNPNVSLRKVGAKTQFILKDDQSPQSYQTMSNDVDTIEKFIAPHGQILIDLYFRIIHPSYPILHKKVFLEKYSRTHREFSAPLLAAVYVLAVQWWDYDPLLNRFPRPNVDLILKIGLNNYFLEILKRPKLSAVQAGLLLLQCKHIVRVSHNANNANNNNKATYSDSDYSDWVLCSQVTALAEELGLGLDCNDWKLPKWERGLRKRLAWAVYIEDKWLSLKNSRPSHINYDNWVVVNLLEEDFPEKHGDGDLKEGSSDIDNGKKNFLCLVDLSMILSDILSQLYSMKAMKTITDISTVLRLAKPLQLKLRNWYHSLPLELQMSSLQPRKLCSNGYLHLAYFATELTLHRKIITIIHQQSQNGEAPPNQLIQVCRTAAKTRLLASIEFVRDLKPEHIHSFWHSSSSANFTLIGTFAAILFMSSSTKEEADFYKDQIFNYRWILKISSKGFDQVGDALLELDMVLNHIPGILNGGHDLPMSIPTIPNVPTIDYQKIQRQSPQKQSPSVKHSPVINGKNGPGSKSGAYRMQSQSNHSPYNSPSYSTTPISSQTVSRGGPLIVNSPQSSQGLSPKEIIKQQRTVVPSGQISKQNSIVENDDNDNSPRKTLAINSPEVSRSPQVYMNTPQLGNHNDKKENFSQ